MGVVDLKPVDRVSITTLVDNNLDVLMPDFGLVRRWGPVGTAGPVPVIPAELAEGGKSADFVKAEHGYSALVEIETTPTPVALANSLLSLGGPEVCHSARGAAFLWS